MKLPKSINLALFILIIAIVASGLACNRSKGAPNNNAAAAPATVIDVTTTAAILRQLPRYFEASGSFAANQQTDVAPETSGKVLAVGVDMGSYVRRGQMIVKLDDADFRIRIQQAQAKLDQAKATLRQNEARIGLRPGQKFNPATVPEVAAATAALDLAEKNLRRYERLVESGDISRAVYDQQRSQRDQLREQREALIHQAQ